jgi:hypothetical protein
MTCLQSFNSENGTQEQEQANAMMAPDGFPNQEPLLLLPLTSLLGFQHAAAATLAAAATQHASSQHQPSLSEQRETLTNIIDLVLDLLVDEDDFLDLFQGQ